MRQLQPTTTFRWVSVKTKYFKFFDRKTLVLEQWHNWQELTDLNGWLPIQGGEWKQIEIKKED